MAVGNSEDLGDDLGEPTCACYVLATLSTVGCALCACVVLVPDCSPRFLVEAVVVPIGLSRLLPLALPWLSRCPAPGPAAAPCSEWQPGACGDHQPAWSLSPS